MRHREVCFAVLLLLNLAVYVRAEEGVELPDTPAGKQATALLQVLEGGDREAIKAFVEANFSESFLSAIPLDAHIQANAGFAEQTGGVVPQKVSASSDTTLRFLGQARKGNSRFQVNVEVDAEPPHKIARLGFMRPQPWADIQTPPVPDGELSPEQASAHLDDYLSTLAKADVFSGAVLIAHGDEIAFHKAYGLANRAWQAPNKPDTKFNLGSMNKMFTAVAIAQLMEQGKLSLEDPISKHLPDYPNADAANRVTIRHLLSHTSGLSDYFNEEFMKTSRDQFRDIDDYMPLFADEPLQFEPGERFSYSNAGFMVLGAIVQKVSGQDYFDYVREHIYQPAGMRNSDSYEMDRDTPNLATGYTREGAAEGEWKNNVFLHVIRGGPAGGGYSTAEDLLRFSQALLDGKLIKAETLEQFTKPNGSNPNYGLGFEIYREQGQQAFGHRGGFPGVSAMLGIDPQSRVTIAILSNVDSGAMPVYDRLGELRPFLAPQKSEKGAGRN